MTFRRPLAALLIALAISACSGKSDTPAGTAAATSAGPVAAVPPPAGKAWTDIVAATPEDGMRIGNPDAPIKLVEYASFTCPHCKHLADEGADTLQQKYVSTGKVSWEFRSTLIHGPDAPLTLLMNCRGPEPYFKLAQQLFASQDTWFNKIIAVPPAEQQRWQGLAPVDQFRAMMEAGGLYGFFAARGLPRSRAETCLADQQAIDRMTTAQQRYSAQDNVTSTPTLLINKTLWTPPSATESVWPQLNAALASMTR